MSKRDKRVVILADANTHMMPSRSRSTRWPPAGVLMADIWKDQRIVTVDMLGDEFLETVQTGDPIAIHPDGTVEIG